MKGWTTIAEISSRSQIRRLRVVADDTGAPAEMLVLRTHGVLHPAELRGRFLDAHRALIPLRDPALIRTLHLVDEADEVAVVRAPLEDVTAADLAGPLPAHEVAYLGARMLPAVILAGQAMGGVLVGDDVGLDERGRPILAPLGPVTSLVDRKVLGAVAPESFDGAPPNGTTALFGLGTLLFRLATGRNPSPQGSLSASALNHRVPPKLDRAIAMLRSPDPAQRSLALPLLHELAPETADLRRHLAAPKIYAPTTPVKTTRKPHISVVLAAPDLVALSPAQRSAAAGIAGISTRTLEQLITQELPLILSHGFTVIDTTKRRDELRDLHGLNGVLALRPTRSRWTWVSLAVILASVPAFVAVISLLLGLLPVSVALAALALAIGAFGVWRSWLVQVQLQLLSQIEHSATVQSRSQIAMRQHPGLHKIESRLSRTRIALDQADVAPAISIDLRGALRDVERKLEPLLDLLQAAQQVLHDNDRERLSKRLAVLETAASDQHTEERHQVVQSIAHLDAIHAQHRGALTSLDALNAELDRIHQTLVLARGDAP